MKTLLVRCAAALALSFGLVAVPGAATAHESCETDEDVPVVIEFGPLDGQDRILCAQHGAGSLALDALHDLGVRTEMSAGSMPMVCRIDGLPTPEQEKCGNALDGDGYWAFLVAREGGDWGYASVGMQEYELEPGDFVALRYQLMSDGENVPVEAAADAQTRAAAQVVGHEESADDAADEDADEATRVSQIALPIAIVAALLVAVAVFVVARRRRD